MFDRKDDRDRRRSTSPTPSKRSGTLRVVKWQSGTLRLHLFFASLFLAGFAAAAEPAEPTDAAAPAGSPPSASAGPAAPAQPAEPVAPVASPSPSASPSQFTR